SGWSYASSSAERWAAYSARPDTDCASITGARLRRTRVAACASDEARSSPSSEAADDPSETTIARTPARRAACTCSGDAASQHSGTTFAMSFGLNGKNVDATSSAEAEPSAQP